MKAGGTACAVHADAPCWLLRHRLVWATCSLPLTQISPVKRLLFLGFLAVTVTTAHAQLFSYGGDDDGPTQTISFGYHWIDFTYNGDDASVSPNFTFVEPALGLVYSRPNLYASVAFGSQDAPQGNASPGLTDPQESLRLIDVAFSTFGGLPIPGLTEASRTTVFIPIVLHSSYRRVRLENDRDDVITEDFNFTVLGIGTGLAVRSELGPAVRFYARATPIIGLALRSFGDTTGRATRVEADAQLYIGRLIQGVGLSIGYRYGLTSWNTSASDLFPNISDQFFDYNGSHHIFNIGFNW